ncbi:MAG TPA: hypothetical protein VHX66_12260 [Solirubrobacteraceae bacterium]|jgi:hypothetical protein|nr:hypothetical protein [Solirubrobacteraceae bacterium]
MPLERHWNRVNTPLRQLTVRERRIVSVALAVLIAATLAIVLIAIDSSPKPTPAGCIDTIVPGVMGGQPVRGCGAQGRAICLAHRGHSDPGSQAIVADCRRAGLLTTS